MICSGILLPTSSGFFQQRSRFCLTTHHSLTQSGSPPTILWRLINPEILGSVAQSGWAISLQQIWPQRGRRGRL